MSDFEKKLTDIRKALLEHESDEKPKHELHIKCRTPKKYLVPAEQELDRIYVAGDLRLEYVMDGRQKKDYEVVKQAIEELDKFKALLSKYEIKDIKALEEIIKDYDDMAKALIQYTLGIEVEVKS